MTSPLRIIRFDPEGPGGLARMELDPTDFSSLPEAQNVHIYFEDTDLGLSAGVWDTTSMQEAFGPYPGDEFIVLLDGQFQMLDAEGGSVPAQKGQSVIFKNGTPVSWKQDGYLKKFFITYLDPHTPTRQVGTAQGGIVVLDPDLALTDEDLLADIGTPQRERSFYTSQHGNFEVGLWDTQTLETGLEPFPSHEFAQVLEGEVTLTEADGRQHDFTAGDVFFIPAGTVCAWNVPTYLRKYYATLDPSIRPGG